MIMRYKATANVYQNKTSVESALKSMWCIVFTEASVGCSCMPLPNLLSSREQPKGSTCQDTGVEWLNIGDWLSTCWIGLPFLVGKNITSNSSRNWLSVACKAKTVVSFLWCNLWPVIIYSDATKSVYIIFILKNKATTNCFIEAVGPPQVEQLFVIKSVNWRNECHFPIRYPPFGIFMMVVEEGLTPNSPTCV